MSCCPCGPGGCPTVQIEVDAVSSSWSKCGFGEFTGDGVVNSNPPKVFLHWQATTSGGNSCNCTAGTNEDFTYDPNDCTCLGQSTRSVGGHDGCDDGGDGGDDNHYHDGCGSWFFGAGCLTCTGQGPDCPTTTSATTQSYGCESFYMWDGNEVPYPCGASGTATVSNEFSTATLIGVAMDRMPGFDGDFADGGPESSRMLSSDEHSFSVRRVRFRFRFMPSPSCCFKVKWQERFRPSGATVDAWGNSPDDVFTDREWTWSPPSDNGSCIPQAMLDAIQDDPGNWEKYWPVSDVFELDEPADNGVTEIVNVETSCNCQQDAWGAQ